MADLYLLVQLLLQICMQRDRVLCLAMDSWMILTSKATLENTLDRLHGRTANGATACVPLNGREALLTTALVATRHVQKVCRLVVADGARVLWLGLLGIGFPAFVALPDDSLQDAQDALANIARLQRRIDFEDFA
mmetsp:Transcript_119393/g.333096  ORF Transcript_119393/g.333096 Transcript_119393/m.333096 type:complete len:135 (-) Transcript_119393:693-1097(-)